MKHINKLSYEERRELETAGLTKYLNRILDLEMELDSRRDNAYQVKSALRALCSEMGDIKVSLKFAEQVFKTLND